MSILSRNHLLLYLLLAGILLITSCDSQVPKDESNSKDSKEQAEEQNDQKFSKEAAEKTAQLLVDLTAANFHEVAMASVAKEKSTSKPITDVAAMLITDHKQVISDLQGLAAKKSVTLPVAESEDAMKETEKFKGKTIAEFNKDWVEEMISMHKKSIQKFEDAVNSANTDPDTKSWAGATLPKLRHHLDELVKLQSTTSK